MDESKAQPSSEDTSDSPLVTTKELVGWWAYDLASSAYSSMLLPIFFPLLLVTVAEEMAWRQLGKDAPKQCSDKITNECLQCVPGKGDRFHIGNSNQELPYRRVYIGSIGIDPVAYAEVALGVSVIFQVLFFVTLSPIADYGNGRRRLLIGATAVGAATCLCSFGLHSPSLWWLGGIFLVVTNVAFGLATVCYYAYLAVLADATPEVRQAYEQGVSEEDFHIVRERVVNRISLTGVASGNIGAVICIFIAFAVAFVPGVSDLTILRVAMLVGGIWWAAFSLFTVAWVRPRPGPPAPGGFSLLSGWRNLRSTIREAKKSKHAFRFILTYFLYADGFNTVNQIGVLFGQRDLCMSTASLVGVVITVSIMAAIGTPFFLFIQRSLGWDNKKMVVLTLGLMGLLPMYGLIGFLTPDHSIGLKHAWELFVFGGYFGFCLGALLSFSRTLLIDMTPRGKEAVFFSLYSVSDKGSSWIGPFLVAVLAQTTGQVRYAMFYLLAVMIGPLFLLVFFVDLKEGMVESGRAKPVNVSNAYVDESSRKGLLSLTSMPPTSATRDNDI